MVLTVYVGRGIGQSRFAAVVGVLFLLFGGMVAVKGHDDSTEKIILGSDGL